MSVGQDSFQSSNSGNKDVCFDIETTGLDPLKDRITAIGISNGFGEDALVDKDEKRILEEFWKAIRARYPYVRLVGFNCWAFDMPFLIIRSLKHGIKIVDMKGRMIDLRYVLSNGNKYQSGKLDDYTKLIGAESKYKNYNGLDAIRLWNEGKLEELREYVLTDAKITHQLYDKIKGIGLIK